MTGWDYVSWYTKGHNRSVYINNFQTCACELFSVSIDLRVMCVRVREREREGGETITRTTTSTLWKKYHGKQPARWVLHCYRQTPSVHLTSAGWLAVANPGIPKKEGQTVNIHQISPETQPDNTKHGISHRTAAANEYPPVPRSPATISADKKINGIVKTKSLILSSDFWSLLSTGQTMLWEG